MPRVRFLLPLPFYIGASCGVFASQLVLFPHSVWSIIRVLAKPTGCIISSPPCATVRFHCNARLCLPIHRHATGSLETLSCFRAEKKRAWRLIWKPRQVVIADVTDVLDMSPLHEPDSRITNNIQFSSCRIDRGRLEPVARNIPAKIVQAPQFRCQRTLKGLTKYLQSCYNGDTIIAIALSQSGVSTTELIMGCRRTPIRLCPV